MALAVKDRVRETSTTAGTGTLTLAGAVSGFQAFSVIGDANTTYYGIVDSTTGAFEVGIGTYTLSGTTLSRTTVLSSSNAGSLVNFAANSKDVFVTYPSSKSVYYDASSNLPITGALNVTSASATSLAVGLTGATNPAFTVDSSTASQVAGLKVTGAATGGTVAVVATDSGSNTNLTVNAKGTGTIGIGSVSTGQVTITPNTQISGLVGIGIVPVTGFILSVSKNMTGATSTYGVYSASQIQSDVTSGVSYFRSLASTAAAAFTNSFLTHYEAGQGTFGVGSTVTNQYGFAAASSLTGATNNYGFFGNIAAGTNRFNLYMNGTANNYMAGSLGIGITPQSNINLYISKNITSATTCYSIANNGTVQSDVTSAASGYVSSIGTQAAAFTLGSLFHVEINQSTFGVGSTVTNQYGVLVGSSLTGATNNYGFYGNIAAGTNRFNFYAGGTANNFMAGSLGIGTTSLAAFNLRMEKNFTGATTFYGIANNATVQSDVTTAAYAYRSSISTQAAAFTLGALYHMSIEQGTIGAASAVTNQYGVIVNSSLTGATNNYGFYSNIASGTGRFNFYAGGTAANFFGGRVVVQTADALAFSVGLTGSTNPAFTVDSSTALQVAGFKVTGAATGGTVALVATDSGANTSLTFNAKGTGTIGIGSVSTGAVTITPATTITGAATLSSTLAVTGGSFDAITISGSSTNSKGMRFQNSAASSKNYNIGSSGGGPSPAGSFFIYDDTAGATRMVIDTSGNVGIGTSSPFGTNTDRVVLSVNGTTDSSVNIGQGGSQRGYFYCTSSLARLATVGAIPLALGVNDQEYMRIDTSGNVGIGTTAPTIKLDVYPLDANKAGIGVRSPASYVETNYFSTSVTAAGTGWFHFYGVAASGATQAIAIFGNGNVQNANNSYGAISDIKLKENIVDATPKLEQLNRVRVVNFNLKSSPEQKQLGVIAQELESIFPGMVDEINDRDADNNLLETKTKSVKYSVFVPMLIKAIQEQQAIIETLTARITALETT